MDLIKEILEIARQTPSPHNVQPWKFKILAPDTVHLFIDKSRMLPKEDLTGSFLISAMCMVIESISILAANRGYRLDVEMTYKDQEQDLISFARLTLTQDASIKPDYEDSLFYVRRTSRLNYLDMHLEAAQIKKLEEQAAHHSYKFGITDSKEQIEKLLHLNIKAVFHDLNDTNYHDEIEGYFRYTDAHSLKKLDGLDHRCMKMPVHEFLIAGKFPLLLKTPILKHFLHWVYRRRIGHVNNIGWIAGPFWQTSDAMNAGRFLMRFWLETAKHGIYFHPFGNLVTNTEAAEKVKSLLGISDIWLIFKIGFSEEPPKSHRLPLKELIIE